MMDKHVYKKIFEKRQDITVFCTQRGIPKALVFSTVADDGQITQPFCYIQIPDEQPTVVYAQPTLSKKGFCAVVKHVIEDETK